MGRRDKSLRIAGCGCLIGIFLGILSAAASVFGGARDPRAFLLLIPLLGLFCASIPMTFLSPDKGLRIGAGCICYPPLLLGTILTAMFRESRPVAWGGLAFLGALVLAGVIAGVVRKHQAESNLRETGTPSSRDGTAGAGQSGAASGVGGAQEESVKKNMKNRSR